MIDLLSKLFGTEKVGIVVAFALAYLQTALVIFLMVMAVKHLRIRWQPPSQRANARS
jgi:Co/Zn/Cd efflux system component